MKKLSISILAISALAFMQSCKTTDTKPAPSITASFPNSTAKGISITAGAPVSMKIDYTTGEDFTKLEVTETSTNGSVTTEIKPATGAAKFTNNQTVNYTDETVSITSTFTFKVTDSKGASASAAALTVTVAGAAVTIVAPMTAAGVLGNDASTTKQGWLVSSSSLVAITSAFDIAYGNGSAAGNQFFIGGSTDASIKSVYSITGTTATEFKTVATTFDAAAFDALADASLIAGIYAAGTVTSDVTRIKSASAWTAGTVFAFKTSAGKIVLAKVTAASTGSAGTVGTIGLSFKM